MALHSERLQTVGGFNQNIKIFYHLEFGTFFQIFFTVGNLENYN